MLSRFVAVVWCVHAPAGRADLTQAPCSNCPSEALANSTTHDPSPAFRGLLVTILEEWGVEDADAALR